MGVGGGGKGRGVGAGVKEGPAGGGARCYRFS